MPLQRMLSKGVLLGGSMYGRANCRIRFARLTQIRRLLGAKEDELEPPFDASTFVVDDEYLILDLVLNWVGILLCNADPRSPMASS